MALLLYYKIFINSLKSKGFKLNPDDTCVANKQMKGKQKLSTQSSNESELVGGDGIMPIVVWSQNILVVGYGVAQNILLQDNMSTMLMEYLRGNHNRPLLLGAEQNGKTSNGKQMRRINIQYSFLRDWLSMTDISIDWCPTKKMVADFMTKPQEGSQFRELRDYIMGKVRCMRCIKPKAGVVSLLGQKKASKKLVKESKVNGKWHIHSDWQQVSGQGYGTGVLIPLCHRRVLGFKLCRRYRTVDGRTVDRLHLEVFFVEDTGSGYFPSHEFSRFFTP